MHSSGKWWRVSGRIRGHCAQVVRPAVRIGSIWVAVIIALGSCQQPDAVGTVSVTVQLPTGTVVRIRHLEEVAGGTGRALRIMVEPVSSVSDDDVLRGIVSVVSAKASPDTTRAVIGIRRTSFGIISKTRTYVVKRAGESWIQAAD
jgi:hypothetical protein